jgi:methylated-DNA-[protein]-cysteine S-methyltransferase
MMVASDQGAAMPITSLSLARRTTHAVDSPVGTLTMIATDGVLSAMYMHEQRHAPPPDTFGEPDPSAFGHVVEQVEAYFARELKEFDIPLALTGTPFQLKVWAALQEIPYGETSSYGELAARIGQPGAARAVGLANGRNPVGIIVPCHRVVGANGKLVGYGGGLPRKERLLALERGETALV